MHTSIGSSVQNLDFKKNLSEAGKISLILRCHRAGKFDSENLWFHNIEFASQI
jgi:hypothetical protein